MAFRDINKKKGPKILGNGILVVDDPSSLNFIGAVTVTTIGRDVTVNITGAATSITGLISAGTNVSITGTGVVGDPYVINSTGGGSMTYPGAGIPNSTGSSWGTSSTGVTNQVTFWNGTNTITGVNTFRFLQSTGSVMLAMGDASNSVTIASNNALGLQSAAGKSLVLASGSYLNLSSANSYSINIASGYQLSLSSYGAPASMTNLLTGGGLTIDTAGMSTLTSAVGQVTTVYSTNTDLMLKGVNGAAKMFSTTYSNGIFAWNTGATDITAVNQPLHVFNSTYNNGLNILANGKIELVSTNFQMLQITAADQVNLAGTSIYISATTYGNSFVLDSIGGIEAYTSNGKDFYNYASGNFVIDTPNHVSIPSLAGSGTRPLAIDPAGDIVIGSGGGGGGSIVIPQLDVRIKQKTGEAQNQYMASDIASANVSVTPITVIAKYKGADQAFMACNPRIWLYFFKQQTIARDRPDKTKDFFHPSHLNGSVYQNKWTGRTTDLPDRVTEWDISGLLPMISIEMEIDPKQWRGPGGSFMTDVFPYRVSDWDQDSNCKVKGSGKRYRDPITGNITYPVKNTFFFFRIVIDNPDPATNTDIPFLFGPESRVVRISPKVGTFTNGSAYYSWMGRLAASFSKR